MKQSQQTPTPEELKNLEADPVWTLLDNASQQKASSSFVDSVMNEIQSESSEVPDNVITSPSFWQRYSLPISAAAVAGIAACVMMTLSSEGPRAIDSGEMAQSAPQFTDAELAFFQDEMDIVEPTNASTEIDSFADQMIAIDNEDPFIMSAEQINILVTM